MGRVALYFWGSNPSGLEMQVVVVFKRGWRLLTPVILGLSTSPRAQILSVLLHPCFLLLTLDLPSTRPGSGEAARTSLVPSQLFLVGMVNVLVGSVLLTHREFFY